MPLRPSPISRYRKRGFCSSSRRGHLTSPTNPEDSIPSDVAERPASISSLPVELLRDIFIWSVQPDLGRFEQNCAPLSLSHTCYLWRQLAIETPLLWNVIHLCHFQYPTKMLQLWIERANGFPLFLSLHTMDLLWGIPRASDPHIRTMKLLIQHASQWHDVDIVGMLDNPCFLSLEPSRSNFGNLKRCCWVFSPDHPQTPLTLESFEHFWTILCSAPLLQDVKLRKLPINAPWAQLLSLTLSKTPLTSGIHALSQCMSLEILNWELKENDPFAQISSLTIPRLTRLSLASLSVDGLIPLFNSFSLPRLTRLDIFVWLVEYCPIPIELTRMLSHLDLPLQHFCWLARNPASDANTTHILRSSCFHHLKRLSLPAVTCITNLCTLLSSAANLPNLRELDLGVEQTQIPTSLLHALRMRNSAAVPQDRNHRTHVWLHQHFDTDIPLPKCPPVYLFKPEFLPNVEIYIKQYNYRGEVLS